MPWPHIINQLEQRIAAAIQKGHIPGLAVAILGQDKVHYVKGWGVRRLGFPEPVTPTTLFQLASLSKPISATLFALLQKKGLCTFNDHPGQYLPHLFKVNEHKNLTIKNMFNHTSGMGEGVTVEPHTPRNDILKNLQKMPMLWKPGEHFAYQNVVYGLVEDIMVAVSGQPFDHLLKEALFKPLNMDRASVGLSSLLASVDRACPHEENFEGNLVSTEDYIDSFDIFPCAAGINASIQDLVPFLQLYLGCAGSILEEEDLQPLYAWTVRRSGKGSDITEKGYGLGWRLLMLGAEKIAYHTGHIHGFQNYMGFSPVHKVGIAILTNTNSPFASQLGLEFFRLYLGHKE